MPDIFEPNCAEEEIALKDMTRVSFIILSLILVSAAIGGVQESEAKKKTLKLGVPKTEQKAQPGEGWIEADSIVLEECRGLLEFSGFDKPYNSRKETFLITNSTGRYIAGVKVKIEYHDLQERMINAREETIVRNIPPGETRMVSLKAFDPQSTLYYHRSRAPRYGGQPFTVRIILQKVLLPK